MRNIIKEPEAINTVPCIVLFPLNIKKYYKFCDRVVLPINNDYEFINILRSGEEFLQSHNNSIVIFGIKSNMLGSGYVILNILIIKKLKKNLV